MKEGYRGMHGNTLCRGIRNDFMRKAQLKFGEQYLWGRTEVSEHRNVASVRWASRRSVQPWEKGLDSEARAGRRKQDVDEEST